MKRLVTFLMLALLLPANGLFAQEYYDYYVPPGYNAHYDYDHQVLQRKMIYCDEDYMDLWNGNYVRIINGYAYIYNQNNSRILYGKDVRLVSSGCYWVNYGDDIWKLYDADGDYTGLWGYDFITLWNGNYEIYVGGYWKLHDSNYNYMGVYSSESIELCWNGYYIYKVGYSQYRVVDEDGDYVGIWGDKISLMHNGNFRAISGNTSYIYDKRGDRVY